MSWPRVATTPEERAEMLAPFGRAWAKVSQAIEKKLETFDDEELDQLIEACQLGRREGSLAGDDYTASFEVERRARAMRNRREAERAADRG